MYIVTAVDYGETCNGHAVIVGKYGTREEAVKEVKECLAFLKESFGKDAVLNEAKNEVWASESEIGLHGTVYDIHRVCFD